MLSARSELGAIEALGESGPAPDIVSADYRQHSICTGAEVIHHIRQVFSRPIPSLLPATRRPTAFAGPIATDSTYCASRSTLVNCLSRSPTS